MIKKTKMTLLGLLTCLALGGSLLASCSDMLEVDSDRQIFDPQLDSKMDSIYFTLGIMKSLQQCADQLVLVNELRGDLAAVNEYTETPLRELYNFTATESNKYDSAYVYYRVINNCNYYIAHRDTTLLSGSRLVAMAEFVQAKAVRAWTYMQLAKLYGSVPFYTQPITGIVESGQVTERRDIRGIYEAFIDDLEYYCQSLYAVPDYGDIAAGNIPGVGDKTVASQKIMFPVDLVTADLCLEAGEYARAARHYFNYLLRTQTVARPEYATFSSLPDELRDLMNRYGVTDLGSSYNGTPWTNSWQASGSITYIPFANNRLRGVTTDLPRIFGFDMYEVEASLNEMYKRERQVVYSQAYQDLAAAQDYYYTRVGSGTTNTDVSFAPLGDLRRYAQQVQYLKGDSAYTTITKFNEGNVLVYRPTMVYLRLAEAINRMGHPEAAFMILKDGINRESLVTDTINYKPATATFFYETLPFLSDENYQVMTAFNNQRANVAGIHSYGSGTTAGVRSPYSLSNVIGQKFEQLAQQTGLVMDSLLCTLTDTINAMEDIICDEMALEMAFEGTRYTDLCRFARHKNAGSPARYGSNYGSLWLRDKLSFKRPAVDLSDEQQWYLPAFFNR